ncbi:minor capsid protein [Clostridium beijerinckii]|uniref:Minor capsid protein n=1 Tax=Clostridium beijerinckii TaxID=1520 RepID=A0A7X9XNR7_CLOBE|nr:minor capsid protein [Clostridium beijerinckii]NMF04564.1 minor capsid protein [Clostridium beijerinckii]
MLSSSIDELNFITGFYSNPLISNIKDEQDEDYKYIYAFVAALLLEYTISEEKLKLSIAERATEFKKANELINKIFLKQIKNQTNNISDILKDTATKMIKHLSGSSKNPWNISNKDVKNILNTEIDGKTYSDRIYDNKNAIAKLIKKQIKDLLDGKTSVNEIKVLIKKTFGTNDDVTDRLVENEISRVCRALDEQYFIDNDIQDLIYVGILDEKICNKCFSHSGKPYKVNDPNRPKLPLHVRCRCFYAIADNNVSKAEKDDIISNKKWLESEFPTEKKFKKHVEKHLKEYGDITPEEYLDTARNLLAAQPSDDIEGFVSKDGFIFKYRKSTNDFAVGRADDKISTIFKPEKGYDYWKEQMQEFKEE